jgi:hypothetical protein
MPIKLTVNNQPRELDIDRETARDDDCDGDATAALRGETSVDLCNGREGCPRCSGRSADSPRRRRRCARHVGCQERPGSVAGHLGRAYAETRGTDQLMAEFKRLARQCAAFAVVTRGDTASGFKGATKVIEAEFEFPYLAHARMEPLNAVCQLSPSRCEI